ncbi:B12-binding domain-containing protein [Brevundimonas sp. AAP58]|uniref:cobalamin B12-binding domain-containing protein n=1 Tax=Brevundimonas sp. AAP58 TaxID=1523422 RepID=UPI0006B980F3|nr:cobalamin B12-binding domain-containing protein [Brevundimonas sp. AAP58]
MADTHRAPDAPSHRRPSPGPQRETVGNVVSLARDIGQSELPASSDPSPLTLARLIEGEIIPRLLMAHRAGSDSDVIPMTTGVIAPAELERFSRMVMVSDLSALVDHVDLLTRRGVGIETIYFDLLSPAAKRLGEMWEADDCAFTDVTIGLCRLQQLVYEFADRMHVEAGGGDGRTALFALTPGDHHSFGLVLVVEYFRRAGWRTVCMPDATARDLRDAVRGEWFDLVGFSMADERWLDTLAPVISDVRTASMNEDVRVIVGGRAFETDPARVARVGADETAGDARQAVRVAEALFQRRQSVA